MTFNKALIASDRQMVLLNLEGANFSKNIIKVNGKTHFIDEFLYDYVVKKRGILTGKIGGLSRYDYTRLNHLLHPEDTGKFVNDLIVYLKHLLLLGKNDCDLWDFTLTLDGDDIVLKKCNKYIAEEILIPNFITKIGREAFKSEYIDGVHRFDNLKKVIIQDGSKLKTIDSSAFASCSSLEDINLPEGLERIGDNAFEHTELNEIIIPSSVKSIGEYSFSCCHSLREVAFRKGSKLKSLGRNSFYFCSTLESIGLPPSLEKIGPYAFGCCHSLESVGIPDKCKDLGEGLFTDCTSLDWMVLGGGVRKIPKELFADCIKLRDITILGYIESIGENAFKHVGASSVVIKAGSKVEPSEDDISKYGVKIVCKYY